MQATAVYTWEAAARLLNISGSYLRLLAERGIASPSVPIVSGRSGQRGFTYLDIQRVAEALGRQLPSDERKAA